MQFEEMYEQKRKEVNKAAEKFEKQLKAAKRSGSKANTDKVLPEIPSSPTTAGSSCDSVLFTGQHKSVCACMKASTHTLIVFVLAWQYG